ncbi:MAG: hypothetical protein ACTSVU_04025 [Promethearchaeota archaeon]
MPRTLDQGKLDYAQLLLKRNYSIQEVRKELKNIFGSAISPNTLIELKHKINQDVQDNQIQNKNRKFDEIQQNKQLVDVYNNLSDDLRGQYILIEKLYEKLDENNEFTHLLYRQSRSIQKFFLQNEYKDLDQNEIQDNIIEYSQEIQKKISEKISKRAIKFKTLCKDLNLNQEWAKLLLHDMEEKSQIVKTTNAKGDIVYRKSLKNLEIDNNLASLQSTQQKNQIGTGGLISGDISREQISFFLDSKREEILNEITKNQESLSDIAINTNIPEDLSQMLLENLILEKKVKAHFDTLNNGIYYAPLAEEKLNISPDAEEVEEICMKLCDFLNDNYDHRHPLTNDLETPGHRVRIALLKCAREWPIQNNVGIENNSENYIDNNITMENEENDEELNPDFDPMNIHKI